VDRSPVHRLGTTIPRGIQRIYTLFRRTPKDTKAAGDWPPSFTDIELGGNPCGFGGCVCRRSGRSGKLSFRS
jgi:hypothetical protein